MIALDDFKIGRTVIAVFGGKAKYGTIHRIMRDYADGMNSVSIDFGTGEVWYRPGGLEYKRGGPADDWIVTNSDDRSEQILAVITDSGMVT